MTKPFAQSLARLKNVVVTVTANDVPDEEGSAAIVVNFSDGTVLSCFYWRLILDGSARLSDHQKTYGLPAPIDAKKEISALLNGKVCLDVHFDSETADLTFVFDGTSKLQVFNFTEFEIWEIRFPDGTIEYSNYALG